MKHIFIIGGTTFDYIITLPEFPKPIPQTIHQANFKETTGSTGSGKSLCLTKLDVPNTLYSILGNDQYGHQIIQHLKDEQVDFIYDFDPKGTERHINIMNELGNRISIFITQSSEFPEMNFNKIEEAIQKTDLIVLNIISYCKQIIPLVKKHKKPVWTDLHDYNDGNPYHEPFIEIADYIFLSSDNLTDYRQTMQNLMQRGKELVVCTHGSQGATALKKNGEWVEQQALTNFKLVDANGAGDNFFSGFLYAFLNHQPLETSMKYGTLTAAYCITSPKLVYDKLTSSFLEDQFLKLF